jgi:cell division protein FtsQ
LNLEDHNLPPESSWRNIPQAVNPRAMSKQGKRRRMGNGIRIIVAVVSLAIVGWITWKVGVLLQHGPRSSTTAASSIPIGNHLKLTSDGVLDNDIKWLSRTLDLPDDATLMSIDLKQLQDRVLSEGQVASATLVRLFPATLSVTLSERTPVARIMAESADLSSKTLLVARDGIAYSGLDYDPGLLNSLPWLDGVALVHQGSGFVPIKGMAIVSDLLIQAKLWVNTLYQTWSVVSLSKLQSDGIIKVKTKEGVLITFGTQDGFFRQLARLDTLMDTVKSGTAGRAKLHEVDLSLGQRPNSLQADVPVSLIPIEPKDGEKSVTKTTVSGNSSKSSSASQGKSIAPRALTVKPTFNIHVP